MSFQQVCGLRVPGIGVIRFWKTIELRSPVFARRNSRFWTASFLSQLARAGANSRSGHKPRWYGQGGGFLRNEVGQAILPAAARIGCPTDVHKAEPCAYRRHLISPSTTVAIAPPWNVLPWKGEFLLREAD